MAVTCPRITKIMLFGPHGRNALLTLQEKRDFGHIALVFPSCFERNVISATWQSCYVLVARVTLYSADGSFIADT